MLNKTIDRTMTYLFLKQEVYLTKKTTISYSHSSKGQMFFSIFKKDTILSNGDVIERQITCLNRSDAKRLLEKFFKRRNR